MRNTRALFRIFVCLTLWPCLLSAQLSKPSSASFTQNGSDIRFTWSAVEDAAVYRIAVFAPRDQSGEAPLVAAVWVNATSWTYGDRGVVKKVGKLASTPLEKLKSGIEYRWMVSAADSNGENKSEWTGGVFKLKSAAAPVEAARIPTVSPAPVTSQEDDLETLDFSEEPETGETLAATASDMETDEALPAPVAAHPVAVPLKDEDSAADVERRELDMAQSLMTHKKWSDAEENWRSLLRRNAANAQYWEGLGLALDGQGLKLEAREAFDRALAWDSDRPVSRAWLQENVRSR